MARVDRRAATKPGPKPPIQAVTMMARKKMGTSSPLGRSRNTKISAAATLKTAKPYLKAADGRCAEVSEYDLLQPLLNSSIKLTGENTRVAVVACGRGIGRERSVKLVNFTRDPLFLLNQVKCD